jgi:type I restriction enzyme S subunit
VEHLKSEYETLQTYKKGMMQKIFSQQVRFKDDKGNNFPEWEEKRLGEVLKERNTQESKSEQYPLMSFVAYEGVSPKGDRYNREFLVNDEHNKKYKQTELGDFIYSSNNLETGSIGLNNYGAASISPVYSIFKMQDKFDSRFMGSYLTRKKFIAKMVRFRQGVVYGQWKIHETEFLKIKESFPTIQEQQKIAEFLSSVDELLESKQQQITKAEEWKKGLMQGLFV